MSKTECEWKQIEEGQWVTGCGETFEFTNDGPVENGFRYCPYCGAAIILPNDQERSL